MNAPTDSLTVRKVSLVGVVYCAVIFEWRIHKQDRHITCDRFSHKVNQDGFVVYTLPTIQFSF